MTRVGAVVLRRVIVATLPARGGVSVEVNADALGSGLFTISARRYILITSLLAGAAPHAGRDVGAPHIGAFRYATHRGASLLRI